jgi:predicted O-methyltransferase YrrM
MSEYDFTADYFSNNIASWEKMYQYLSTTFSSDLNCLEIGTYEGRSAIYILDNFVGSSGKLTVIDNFWDKEYEQRYLYNIKNNTKNKQVITLKGTSMTKLSLLHFNSSESFDFIYIDAGKTASTNMYNLLMSERLLKVGGIMIVDDYNWPEVGIGTENSIKKLNLKIEYKRIILTDDSGNYCDNCKHTWHNGVGIFILSK